MGMEKRHSLILDLVISEYIKTNHPVGSEGVRRCLADAMSAATIRNIFRELEDAGYLEQPHTSAGRIPTDQGYRYFVDHTVSKPLPVSERKQLRTEIKPGRMRKATRARLASQALSRRTEALAVSSWLKEGDMQEAGLAEVLYATDTWETIREMSQVLRYIEDSVNEVAATSENGVVIFIGQENPFLPARHTSLLVRRIRRPEGDVALLLIGPRRMQYGRNVVLLNSLADIINGEGV